MSGAMPVLKDDWPHKLNKLHSSASYVSDSESALVRMGSEASSADGIWLLDV